MTYTAAVTYALLAFPPAFVQAALTFGAPWGVLTMGGKFPGALPHRIRLVSALQCVLLLTMALVALDHGGVIEMNWPSWLIWPVLAVTALSTVANLATPSRPERLLWGPIISAMFICIAYLAFA